MQIGELAGELGLNTRTIRYYEGIGLLPEPERTGGNYRAYGREDLERLRFIRAAQRLGLTLDEIREVLVRIPSESVRLFRSIPYTGSGVFVRVAGWL